MATEVRMALFRPPLPKAFRQVAAVRGAATAEEGVERRAPRREPGASSSSSSAAAAPHRPAVVFVCVTPCVGTSLP